MIDHDAALLVERIKGLTREEALEAALALADDLGAADHEQDNAIREFTAQVETNAFAHLPEVDDLARILLISAGLQARFRPGVEEILDAAGRKAFIFGGTEIVMLAGLGILALRLILSKAKDKETEHIEITSSDNGKVILKYKHEVRYVSLSTQLMQQLTNLSPPS